MTGGKKRGTMLEEKCDLEFQVRCPRHVKKDTVLNIRDYQRTSSPFTESFQDVLYLVL